MDNDIFGASLHISDRNPAGYDGMFMHMYPGSLVQTDSLNIDGRNLAIAGLPFLPTFQRESTSNAHDANVAGHTGAESSFSGSRPVSRQCAEGASVTGSTSVGNYSGENRIVRGEFLSATAIAHLLAENANLNENLVGVDLPTISGTGLGDFRNSVSGGCHNSSRSSFTATENFGYGLQGDMSMLVTRKDPSDKGQLENKWLFDGFVRPQELTEVSPTLVGCPPYHFIGSSGQELTAPNKSTSSVGHTYGYYIPNSELSLSLATCQSSNLSTKDQCSDLTCSGVTEHSLREGGFGSDKISNNRNDLSLNFSYYRPDNFSHLLSGSKYLNIVQQILSEVARYSLGNIEYQGGSAQSSWNGSKIDSRPISIGQNNVAKKAQLLALLQAVCVLILPPVK